MFVNKNENQTCENNSNKGLSVAENGKKCGSCRETTVENEFHNIKKVVVEICEDLTELESESLKESVVFLVVGEPYFEVNLKLQCKQVYDLIFACSNAQKAIYETAKILNYTCCQLSEWKLSLAAI